jgi:hypothetical protein
MPSHSMADDSLPIFVATGTSIITSTTRIAIITITTTFAASSLGKLNNNTVVKVKYKVTFQSIINKVHVE